MEKNGFRRDMWPSRYLMPDLFEQFYKEFDKERKDYFQIHQLSPSYRIYFTWEDAEVIDVYADLEKNRDTFERLEPGSMKQLEKYLAKAKYQYEVAMKEFVPKNYDSVFQFLNLRMAIEGTRLHVFENMKKYVKRYFKTEKMQKIMQYPLVFLGTAPDAAPALYNIMSYVDFGMWVRYPEGWINAIIQSLVTMWKELGVTYHTDSEVTHIDVNEEWVATSVELAWWEHVSFDRVISNADYHWTETHLLDQKRQSFSEKYREKRTMAPSGFILYLWIEWRVQNIEHHTLLFSEDREKNFWEIFKDKLPPEDPSLYLCCPSKTDASTAPDWYENMFVLVPFPPGVYLSEQEIETYKIKIYEMIEQEIGEQFQDRIVEETIFTSHDFTSRYHAYQWTALWLAHTLMQTAVLRPNTISKKVKNLCFAGGYTNPWIGMPMCLISGKLAAERVK